MSQSSQTESNGDDLRTMIQKSLDNHRRLMEEIERLETATDDVNKATTMLEGEVRQTEEKLAMKNIQLQSVYDEIKTTRRSVERLNQSCSSTKQQCATLERQLRQDASTVAADTIKREKAVAQADQMMERAHAMFNSADWVVEVKRRLEELTEIEEENAKAQEELDEAEMTRDELQAFINKQNELPFEEFVVSTATMRLENDALWAQVRQHAAVIKHLELEDAEVASDDGDHEFTEPKQPPVVSAREQKVAEPAKPPPKVIVRQQVMAEPVEPPPVVCAGEREMMVDQEQAPIINSGEQEAAELDETQETIEPGQSLVVNVGDEEAAELEQSQVIDSVQLAMLNDNDELVDQSVSDDAAGTRGASQDARGSSSPLRAPMVPAVTDLSSSQLLADPLNESQADLGGSFMAMFGFNNSQESTGKGSGKGAPAFGFGFGGLDTSDQQADGSSKKDEGGVPFSLFGF